MIFILMILDSCIIIKFLDPLIRHEYARNAMKYRIPKLYNSFPKIVTEKINTHSMHGFSNYAKKFLLDSYSSSCVVSNCYVCSSWKYFQFYFNCWRVMSAIKWLIILLLACFCFFQKFVMVSFFVKCHDAGFWCPGWKGVWTGWHRRRLRCRTQLHYMTK